MLIQYPETNSQIIDISNQPNYQLEEKQLLKNTSPLTHKKSPTSMKKLGTLFLKTSGWQSNL
ncbi:hypothetical protein CRC_00501 [Cylindrospermopsis raciborskii CS-505]|uniref:Uncharacterized protein n=1 Tax=Cylindrospermopsis raciborskii CS-505 TaxID=533240 RepID=A0A853M9V6_9CYAN|nr:hypothetical protein CRC_00501 [Cylindrospermopsis raciborskii CS-505]OBU75783.1 hypothetical protein A9P98_05225 [Cylindrospermopsis raciborskii CS-505]